MISPAEWWCCSGGSMGWTPWRAHPDPRGPVVVIPRSASGKPRRRLLWQELMEGMMPVTTLVDPARGGSDGAGRSGASAAPGLPQQRRPVLTGRPPWTNISSTWPISTSHPVWCTAPPTSGCASPAARPTAAIGCCARP
jgi:hypothetical protein